MNKWQDLYAPTVRKLNTWEISPRAKAVALEIASLSMAAGKPDVELWQRELTVLTGYAEECVSKAVNELMDAGVLQRRGRRGSGPRIYRLLTNAELVEPVRMVNEAAARGVRAAVQQRNAARLPGDDPGGQAVLLLTGDERLAEQLADGSAERALDDERDEIAAAVRRSITGGDLPGRQVGGATCPPGKSGWQLACQASRGADSQPRGRARTRVTLYVPTAVPQTLDVGCAPKKDGAAVAEGEGQYALELVRLVVSAQDFAQWKPKWEQRVGLRQARDPALKPQPQLVIEAAAEVARDLREGRAVDNPGGSIVDRVRRWLGAHRDTFRLFLL